MLHGRNTCMPLLHQHERLIYASARVECAKNSRDNYYTAAIRAGNDFYVNVYVRSRENALFAQITKPTIFSVG